MEERDWHIISALYEAKSITRAAKNLYLSQPALTARLHQIEQEMNATIALRTSRGLVFTPQGDYLAGVAGTMLQQMEEVRERLKTMKDAVGGTLQIAASQFMTKYVLPALLKQFKDSFPSTDYRLVTTWSADVYSLVRRKDVQLGFVLDNADWEGERVLLLEDPLVIASTRKLQLEELPDLPRIEFRTNPSSKVVLDRWWQSNFGRPPKICMEVDILDTCREMVSQGLGYSILPRLVVEKDPAIHMLPLLDRNGKPYIRKGWMIMDSDSFQPPLVYHFMDFVKGLAPRLFQGDA